MPKVELTAAEWDMVVIMLNQYVHTNSLYATPFAYVVGNINAQLDGQEY